VAVLTRPLFEPPANADGVTFSVPFLAVGCLILLRARWHRMGWLLMATGFSLAVALTGFPGVPPEYRDVTGLWTTVFALFTYIMLVFPTGRLDSWHGWRARVARLVVGMLAAFVLAEVVGLMMTVSRGEIPISPVWDVLLGWGYIWTLLLLVGGAVSLVVRFRRSTGERRAQLSWVVASLTLLMASLILTEMSAVLLTEIIGIPSIGDDIYIAVGLAFLTVPISIMVAILRYRLYDLGRLVRRTVSYMLVIGVLALVYAGVVFLFRQLFPVEGNLAIAGSTLAVAALFNPLRRRVQDRVDRRFNRSRHDVRQVVDSYAQSLGNQLDPDRIVDGWIGVVSEIMQPVSVGVWVRSG
jgi:hypothetical protein